MLAKAAHIFKSIPNETKTKGVIIKSKLVNKNVSEDERQKINKSLNKEYENIKKGQFKAVGEHLGKLEDDIEHEEFTEEIDVVKDFNRSSETPMYSGLVKYKVNNKLYYIETNGSSNNYKPGKKMTVFYNDKNPEESYLAPGFTVYAIFIIFSTLELYMIYQIIINLF